MKRALIFGIAAWLLAGGLPLRGQAGVPRWQFSFLERVRQESSDNVGSLDESRTDSSSYLRVKTSVGFRWQAAARLEVGFKLTNEFRYYIVPKTDPRLKKNFDLHEVIVDQLYLQWRNPFSLPLKLTAGRQDIQLGEGFVFWDGGPLDGSRSAYFNGVRLDWELKGKRTLTALYVNQPRTDTILPVINDFDQKLVEQTEEAFGLYFAGSVKKTGVEGYLLRKNVRAIAALPDSGITMLGGRLQQPIGGKLTLTAEGAWQGGHYGARSRGALGGYFHLDFKTGASRPLPELLTLGGIYLGGDDRSTPGRYEGWDPMFSRWPKWSDSFIYHLVREDRVAQWSNFTSLYGSASWRVLEPLKFSFTLHRLGAAQRTAAVDTLSGAGLERGWLAIARLQLDVNRNLSGHFIWESFKPGDFYFAGARAYTWLRFEFLLKF